MPTLTQPDNCHIALPLDEIGAFCHRWKIVRLELFGSATRGDLRDDSDLDFLYVPAGDAQWGWEFVKACDELEKIVQRPVDLVSRISIERSQNRFRRDSILSTAQTIYEA